MSRHIPPAIHCLIRRLPHRQAYQHPFPGNAAYWNRFQLPTSPAIPLHCFDESTYVVAAFPFWIYVRMQSFVWPAHLLICRVQTGSRLGALKGYFPRIVYKHTSIISIILLLVQQLRHWHFLPY